MPELTRDARRLIGKAQERLRDWFEYQFEVMTDRLNDLRQSIDEKLCSHRYPSVYEESRYESGGKVSWMAFYTCSECGEVLSVEASFWGEPGELKRVLEAE